MFDEPGRFDAGFEGLPFAVRLAADFAAFFAGLDFTAFVTAVAGFFATLLERDFAGAFFFADFFAAGTVAFAGAELADRVASLRS